jgi:hypothetical protein
MAVIQHYELARKGEFRFGEAPGLERRFVCVVDDPATTTGRQLVTAIGVDIGTRHPEYTRIPCSSLDINEQYEGSRYHIELVASYAIDEDSAENVNPLLRPDKWRFETGGVTVPALYYFTGAGNGTPDLRPLTNSAFDYFEGLSVDEAQSQAVITGNRQTFPSSLAVALTNTINFNPYLGGAVHTWKCAGISAERKTEFVFDEIVNYWSFTTTLIYRQTGWNLLLPDMGFNALVGGQKRRVMTFDFENSEWVASPVPMGLDGLGAQTFGAPAILTRRVYRHVDFNTYFGQPPP